MTIGMSGAGQTMAISPEASAPLFPVLSAICQAAGRPPRKRFAPVLQAIIQSSSRFRAPPAKTPQVSRHRHGGGGVMGIAGFGTIQFRFVMVQAGHGISRRTPEGGQRGRPTASGPE